MKIVFLGNMNNLPFYFAKEIKDRGYDVTFIVDANKELLLDRPESLNKIYVNNYPDWIIERPVSEKMKFLKFCYPKIFYSTIIKYLNSFDVIFLNGDWISLGGFLKKEKLVIDIFAGFDLDLSADYNKRNYFVHSFKKSGSIIKKIIPDYITGALFTKFIRLQRKGIRRANVVNYYLSGINIVGDNLLNEIKDGQQYKRLELRGFDCNKFEYKVPEINREKFVILNITRFFYRTDRNDNKRNDIMIKGIGQFIKKNTPSKDFLEIIFFNKGVDLEDAKRLCTLHGLDPYIQWRNEVSLHELKNYFEYCDVAFDQLGEQWVGSGLYSMLTGRPLIANGRPDIFEKYTGEKLPICQATNEEEVENWLTKLYNNRELVKDIGIASRAFVFKHYDISHSINFFIDCIENR